MIEDLWKATEKSAHLPYEMSEHFFDERGPMPSQSDNQRSYHRFYLRGKAILQRDGKMLGVYSTDVSRQGIGFLSPVQLFPKERVSLRLSNGAEYRLEMARCRRLADLCYECGARFAM